MDVRMPDGVIVTGVPDDITQEELLRRYKLFAEENRTVAGYVKETAKALPRGLVGGLESAALGAAALLPGDTKEGFEKDVRESIKKLAGRLKPDVAPGYEEAIPVKLGEAIGSMGSLVGTGGVGGLAARGLGLAAGVGRTAAVAPTAAAMGAGEARERAVDAKATPEQIERATQLGIIPGIAELAPVEHIFRMLPKELTGTILNRIQRAFTTGGFEAAQETASGVAQNLIAQQVYKPSQELIEGVGEQAAYGFGAGAIVQGLLDAALGKRARPAPKPAAKTPPAETPPAEALAATPDEDLRNKLARAESNYKAVQAQADALDEDSPLRKIWERKARKAKSIFDSIAAEIPETDEERTARILQEREERQAARAPVSEGSVLYGTPEGEILKSEQDVQAREAYLQQRQQDQKSAIAAPAEVTRDMLVSLGFATNKGAFAPSKLASELLKLDLSKPDDAGKFIALLNDTKSRLPKNINNTAVEKLVGTLQQLHSPQAQGVTDGRPETRIDREGMVAPVQSDVAAGPGAAETTPADVGRAEGDVAAGTGREGGAQPTLSDVEEVETAKEIAFTTKSKKEFEDAFTYLVYFANDPDVGPTAKIAARAALKELNVPEAEVQAAWESISISAAAAQQERSEDAALEASKKAQRNIADQERRAKQAETRAARVTPKKPATAKEKAEYASAERRMVLKAPTNVPFQTVEDANALLNTYLSDVEQGDPAAIARWEKKNKQKFKRIPAKEYIDEADRGSIAQFMREGKFDAAHTAIVSAVQRAVTAAKADMYAKDYLRETQKAERRYRLSHRPIGSGLSKDAVGLLQKGDLKGALKLLGETGSNPIIRTAARKILSAIKNTKVLVRKTPTGDAGIYSSITDTIYIDPEGLHEHTLLHEAMHAAVSHVLANPNHQLTKKLQRLFSSLDAGIRDRFETKETAELRKEGKTAQADDIVLQEFASEAISNQEFQDVLRGQPKNWWGRLVDAIRGFLGLSKAKQVEQTLDQLLEAAPSEARRGDVGTLKLTTAAGIGPDLQGYLDRNEQQIKDITERNKQGSWVKALRNAIVEKGASLTEKLQEKGKESGVRAAQVYGLSLRSMDLAINSMLNGAIELDPKTRNQWFKVNTDTPSFRDIQAEIDKIAEVVGDRKTAQRIFGLGATILRLRSPEISPEIRKSMNVSAEDMKAGDEALARFGTEIRTALAKWTEFKNALLKVGEKTGRFTKEDVEQWMKAPEYVPWHRILDDAKFGYETKRSTKQYFSRLVDNGKIAELIGGDVNKRPIGDIFDNMINLSTWLINTTVKNHTANQLADALVDIGSATQLKTKEQSKTGNVTKTYRNGEETFWDLDDPYDMDAFGPVSTIALPVLSMFGRKVTIPGVTNLLRKGTTYMPGFVVSQLFQDAYRATILSGLRNPFSVGANTFTNFGKAIGPAREENLTYKALMEAGIVARADFAVGEERGRLDAALDRSQKGVNRAVKGAVTFMENMARASDAAQRMSLFEATMKETGDKLDALSRASEIINFQRQGTNAVFNTLRQTVPFMNAYIQGMDVIYRSLFKEGISAKSRSEALRRLYATSAKVFALSMVYAMLVSDDDEYKNTPDHEKLTSFIIPGSRQLVKDITGVDIGGNLRIPTPQDPLGFLFKSIPEQVYNYVASQGTATPMDNTKFLRIMRDGALNAVSPPNTIPQFAKPTIELMTNYSFFTGNPIVGKYLQSMPKEAQFTETTSELAKILSPFTPMSPVQLDYFIRGTLGTAGGASMYFLSQAINAASSTPLPDSKLNQNPLVRPFITGREGGGLKEDYYELREKAQQVANVVSKYKDADPQEALRYAQENPKLYALAKSGLFTQMDAVIKQLRDARQIIRASKTMTAEEKRERLDKLDATEIQVFQRINLAVMRNIGGL